MNRQDTIKFCDLHCDTAMELINGATLSNTTTQVNIPFMKEGHIALQLFACYVPPGIPKNFRVSVIMKLLDKLEEEIENNQRDIEFCLSAQKIIEVMKIDKIGAVLTIENGAAIENDLKNLALFYERGIRCMTIVHAESHDWAISTNDKNPAFDGLNEFGEKVINTMNEMGIIIDLSHAHDRTVEKVLQITTKPVIASHSCVKTLCDSPRNLNDLLIKKIADNGGMIGINFYPGFLDSQYARIINKRAGDMFLELGKMERQGGIDVNKISYLFAEFREKIKNKMADIKVPVDRIIDHVDYIVNLVGDDHVGFGSDFDGIPHFPEGVDDCRSFNLIYEKLVEKGYSREKIDKIAFKNFLRVFGSQF